MTVTGPLLFSGTGIETASRLFPLFSNTGIRALGGIDFGGRGLTSGVHIIFFFVPLISIVTVSYVVTLRAASSRPSYNNGLMGWAGEERLIMYFSFLRGRVQSGAIALLSCLRFVHTIYGYLVSCGVGCDPMLFRLAAKRCPTSRLSRLIAVGLRSTNPPCRLDFCALHVSRVANNHL
jgi:hypothetical protein